jgi:DNA-binding winged helix-turn-helix (wHTH) protein
VIRYRFHDFTLSPQRRLLARNGQEVPLIPRYFDLLVLLIERRHEAVHRREIFERVWADTNVSESALSQAVRTIRRTLGDDSKEPRFIRTVSRHGYRFVLPDVIEEADDEAMPAPPSESPAPPAETTERPRSVGAAAGGALAGIVAGGVGGLILAAAPGSHAPIAIAPVLAVIGAGCGALGGTGVGLGLSLAPSRSRRAGALIAGAALGGGLAGLAVQWLSGWGLAALLGLDVAVGGGLEGLGIGAAAGAGYALGGGPADPPAARRLHPALVSAVLCGLAGLTLTLTGHPLVGGTIHAIAHAAEGSRATLAPLGRLIGERDFGPVTSAIIAFGEAAMFGLGVAFGLIRRPPGRQGL